MFLKIFQKQPRLECKCNSLLFSYKNIFRTFTNDILTLRKFLFRKIGKNYEKLYNQGSKYDSVCRLNTVQWKTFTAR